MSTFMQLMDGKRAPGVVESVRVTKAGTMFFKMNGKEVKMHDVHTHSLRTLGFVFSISMELDWT